MKHWWRTANGSDDSVVLPESATRGIRASDSKFFQRVFTTFTVGPLAIWLIYLGDLFYFIPLAVIISLATVEYTRLLAELGWRVPLWILLPSVLAQLFVSQWPEMNLFGPALLGSLLLAMAYALWLYEQQVEYSVPATWLSLMAGILLLGWLGGHFFRLRLLEELAVQWTVLVMVGTWVADSAAYLFGKKLGRRKLAPRLSPNKTVEGYVAGVLLGTLFTVIIALILQLPLLIAFLVGMLISTVSPAGDLAVSLLKREAGVKDSGQMLPGHGGALDRIDSLVWSVTIAYYLVILVG